MSNAAVAQQSTQEPVTISEVRHIWTPIWLSWLMMALELPVVSAFVARMADAKLNLASFGGVVFPISLIIEAPIIMLLSASTALCKDWRSFKMVWRFMMLAGAGFSALHLLVAATPLYDWVVRDLIGAPEELIERARIGLICMTPWTWAIAYRRFYQGILIRAGKAKFMGLGTAVRLLSLSLVLVSGFIWDWGSGVTVASSAMAIAVTAEAAFVGWAARGAPMQSLRAKPPLEVALTWRRFMAFYAPLAVTPLLTFLTQPIGSAALSRMPDSIDSLATWPVLLGVMFILRSFGMGFSEVVIATVDRPGAAAVLKRFTSVLVLGTTGLTLLWAATPLADLWFVHISGISPALADMATIGIWIAMPLPALTAIQSYYQGIAVQAHKTRVVTESVIVYLLSVSAVYVAGVLWQGCSGFYIGILAVTIGNALQTWWLRWRD